MTGKHLALLGGPFGAGPAGDPNWQNVSLLSATGTTNAAQNNTFLDSSTNNFTITRNGNTTQGTFTPFSQAAGYWSYYFAGGSDTVSFPDNAANDFGTGAFTVEFWVYFTSVSGQQELVTKYGSVSTGWTIQLYNGVITVNFSGDGFDISGTSTIAANQWYHIAVSGTPSSPGIKLFINGSQEGSTYTGSTSLDSTAGVSLSGSNGRVSGYISNVRLLKGTAQYTSNFTLPTTPLTNITNTSLLTAQSNRFIDNSTANSGSGFAATIGGTPSVQAFQPFGAPTSVYSTTNVGGSGYFDGTGDYLTVPAGTAFALSGEYTMELWFYPNALSGFVGLLCGSQANAIWLYLDSSTGNILLGYNGADQISTSSKPIIGQWNHIAVSRNSSNVTSVYLNGTRIGTATLSTSYASSSGTFDIARVSTYTNANGYFSGARVVKGTAVYDPSQTTLTVPTAPLTAITNTSLLLNFTNAGIYDNAAKNDMETVGNAQVSTSVYKYGTSSAYFDGTGDYVSIPNSPSFDFGTGQFTIEFWLYANSLSNSPAVVAKNAAQGSAVGWFVEVGSNTVYFGYGTNGGQFATFTTSLATGAWYHIACTRIGGTYNCFVNGNSAGPQSGFSTSAFDNTNPLLIGRGFGSASYDLNGYISDLRITKGLARYTYNFTSPAAALPNFYQAQTLTADPYFDYTTLLLPGNGTNGAQNNTFLDSSTNAFSITRNGNTTQGTFSPFSQTGWSNYLDGTGDYLIVPNSSGFVADTSFTVESWVFLSSVSGTKIIASYANSSGTDQWELGVGIINSGKAEFYLTTGPSSATYVSGTSAIPTNQWVHIAGVRDGSTLRIFVNGVEEATQSYSGTPRTPSSVQLYIGQLGNNTSYVTGYISNLRIVRGTAVYTANFTPSTTPLTAITNTSLLTCQSNRFLDTSTTAAAITAYGDISVQAFSPFNPTAAWSAATNGGSGYFDGTGDFLSVPSSSNTAVGTGDFTLQMWVYDQTASGNYAMWFDMRTSGNSSYLQMYRRDDNYYGCYLNGTFYGTSNGTTWKTNQWNHCVLTRVSGTSRIFLNGTEITSFSDSNNYGANTIKIGCAFDNTYNLKGYMSDVQIIKGTGYTSITVPTVPSTAITNTQLLTSFTNAGIYDATAKNDLETVGNAQISTTQYKWGSTSIKFDGNGDQLFIPTTPNLQLGAGDWTIEFWMYTSDVTTYQDLVGLNYNTNQSSYAAARLTVYNGQIQMLISYASSDWNVNQYVGSVSANTWTHIAYTRYGGNVQLFINGNLAGSASIGTNSLYAGTYGSLVGNVYWNGGNFYYNGYMQDLRITKGIARYTQNFTPPAAAFQLY